MRRAKWNLTTWKCHMANVHQIVSSLVASKLLLNCIAIKAHRNWSIRNVDIVCAYCVMSEHCKSISCVHQWERHFMYLHANVHVSLCVSVCVCVHTRVRLHLCDKAGILLNQNHLCIPDMRYTYVSATILHVGWWMPTSSKISFQLNHLVGLLNLTQGKNRTK